ncbi:hypothetical protein QYF61_019037 [Mycteria americana]|uniref:Tetratricopeptide repeat protein n=1 Tax=Mycteria americana TaxID=33587 RepID=A0AAN7NVE2_MYCAM|nr:hypothetical protein QYF61_019037 [Mycteria americana]
MVPSDRTGGNGHKLKYRKLHLNIRKLFFFYCEDDQTLEQIVHRGCGVSVLEDIQNLTVHGPGQPAPADPALSRGPLENFREHGANLQLPFALIQNAMLHMMEELQSVFKWLTTTAPLLTNRGVINQLMGYLPCAMKDYQQAISVDPNYALAYFNAANIYFHNRQFSQAYCYYSKALQLDPRNESAVMNRAITNTLLNNIEEAKEDFEKAICLCPFSAAVYFNRANFYNGLKQYDLAEKDISTVIEEPMRNGAMLDLVLTNREELVGNVKLKGSLGCSDHEMVEFKILRAPRRVHSKLSTLDFRRADFGLFRDLLGRVT